MAKIDNMMAIIWMLKSGERITAKQISEKLEINIRTVYRYIDTLSASGVPIIADAGHNGGYTLLNNFIEAPLFFDVEEQIALLQATIFAKEAGYFFDEALERAASKLKMYSNEEQEMIVKQYLEGVEVISSVGKPNIESLLRELEDSIVNDLSIEIEYHTKKEEQSKGRTIDPYGLVYWSNNWYIVGFCHMRNEIRSFRVDRIYNINQTKLKFNKLQDFSASKFFMQNLMGSVEEKKKFSYLVIGGKASALDNLCRHWFLGHYFKERTLNQVTFLLEDEIIYKYVPQLLLPYGKSIQVIEPSSLKGKIIEDLLGLIEYYKV
ncbi:Predicted DNA-binding transcriptional regulator YafY, contains an HTH and WYL domains [Clostridium cavendishii DSM 21758]|uniref:Predicted DNA-binding transcriptional regulator YafY, contains an HTH and WYL domains n=1 Tax=Clostridium cavendishii DSM 21758 TaxID=1121302 RepID=A0A1M6GRA5_9CLOT|nr:YafY family protein [Clostridium cavendishii]SHJ12396.1 Predicted DNA-binding transcriptional regulator YafY, contains an HTH and WYL domains [Clostridium cavendishii DSM 21758]